MELTPHTIDRTHDHWWWRPGWGPGIRYYTFHLTFEDAPDLHAAARSTAERLTAADAVGPVPTHWLHLTMTGVGFVDEVDADALEAVLDETFRRSAAVAAEPLRFDRAFVYDEGVGLASRPAAWLYELKRIQSEAVASVRDVANDGRFQPHVSLAYFSGEADVPRVDAAVRALPEQIVVEHPRLSLLELGRDDRVYTWRVVDQRVL